MNNWNNKSKISGGIAGDSRGGIVGVSQSEYERVVELNKLQTNEINLLKALNSENISEINSLKSHISKITDLNKKQVETIKSLNSSKNSTVAPELNELAPTKEQLNQLQQQHEKDIEGYQNDITILQDENKRLRVKIKKLNQ